MTETQEQIAEYNHITGVTKITMPLAPISINTMYSIYKGRKLLTKSGRKWRDQVDPILSALKVHYSDNVGVQIDVWPKAARKFDLDNCAKSILDALQRNGILENDDLVYTLVMHKHDKHPRKRGGAIWVDIWPYNPEV